MSRIIRYFVVKNESMSKTIKQLLLLSLFLATVQCAKRASPTGGPRDSLPPVLVNATPKLNTVFFDKEAFTLNFDEYITLKDISKQLIISPH